MLIISNFLVIVYSNTAFRITLESPCTAVIHLAHNDLHTQDLHQISMFMERKLRLLLLKIIEKEINALSEIKDSIWEGTWTLDRVMLVIVLPLPSILPKQNQVLQKGCVLRRRQT